MVLTCIVESLSKRVTLRLQAGHSVPVRPEFDENHFFLTISAS